MAGLSFGAACQFFSGKMAKKIIVQPQQLKKVMATQVSGRTVNIGSGGAFKITKPASKGKPEYEVEIPAATQQDLQHLFKQGHPFLMEVDDTVSTTAKA